MPRPRKWKNVCCLPETNLHGPIDPIMRQSEIIMQVEEYETIRLIDFEGLTQEQCAERMNVARATVQKIYFDARKKLADSLIKGNVIRIEGGDYRLYDACDSASTFKRCHRHRNGNIKK